MLGFGTEGAEPLSVLAPPGARVVAAGVDCSPRGGPWASLVGFGLGEPGYSAPTVPSSIFECTAFGVVLPTCPGGGFAGVRCRDPRPLAPAPAPAQQPTAPLPPECDGYTERLRALRAALTSAAAPGSGPAAQAPTQPQSQGALLRSLAAAKQATAPDWLLEFEEYRTCELLWLLLTGAVCGDRTHAHAISLCKFAVLNCT